MPEWWPQHPVSHWVRLNGFLVQRRLAFFLYLRTTWQGWQAGFFSGHKEFQFPLNHFVKFADLNYAGVLRGFKIITITRVSLIYVFYNYFAHREAT